MIDFAGYGRRLGAVMTGAGLVGVYVHGSAVLGGFIPARSDVDVLAVVKAPMPEDAQVRVGEALRDAARPCPGSGLELSVITAATAAELADCRFEVHVAVSPGDSEVMPGAGRAGDPDLVLYVEVCRRAGLAAVGPPPAEVFGRVPHARLIEAITLELDWGVTNAAPEYAVLNACRARRFAVDGTLCSKVDGGMWFLDLHPGHPLVLDAMARQRSEPPAAGDITSAVVDFVADTKLRVARSIH